MKKLSDSPELIEHLKGDLSKNVRSLLLLLGGGMNMFFGWGVASTLEQLGLINFTTVVGISAGALIGSYFVAGQATLGASLYYKKLASRRFVGYLRKNVFDLDYGEALLRAGEYRIDIEKISCSSTQLYLALTRWSDGKGVLVDAKSSGVDMVTLIKGAVAPPGIYNDPLYPLASQDSQRYADGGVAFPFPLREVMCRFKPTHLVVIANSPLTTLPTLPPLSERLFLRCLISVPLHIRQAMMLRYAHFKRGYYALRRIKTAQTFVFAPAPRTSAYVLSRSGDKLYRAFCKARDTTLDALLM